MDGSIERQCIAGGLRGLTLKSCKQDAKHREQRCWALHAPEGCHLQALGRRGLRGMKHMVVGSFICLDTQGLPTKLSQTDWPSMRLLALQG